MDEALCVIARMHQRAKAAGNKPAADNYRAALIALARARRGPIDRYREALAMLTAAERGER
jgi:hypothetical protein